jgi:hypothetical protein
MVSFLFFTFQESRNRLTNRLSQPINVNYPIELYPFQNACQLPPLDWV